MPLWVSKDLVWSCLGLFCVDLQDEFMAVGNDLAKSELILV